MPFCAIFGCANSSKKSRCSEIKFHRFPKGEDLKRKWINACRRDEKINLKSSTICSVYFEEKYKKKSLQQTLLGYSPKNCRYLTEDAIPTQFLPSTSGNEILSNNRNLRTEERCRKRLVDELIAQGNSLEIINQPSTFTASSQEEEPSREDAADINLLLSRIKQLEEENEKLKLENASFKIERTDVERQKRDLFDRIKVVPLHVSDKNAVSLEIEKILSPLFSHGQINVLSNKPKRPIWSKEDIAFAISLRSVSPKAYRYLRNKLNYPLPHLSTLRRWALSLNINTGFLDDVLSIMKTKTKSFSSSTENIVCLSYDEMTLDSKIEFDVRKEEIIGPCTSVQVMVARSIFGGWKQPIYYNFDSSMTKDIVMEAVQRLSDAGYETVAIVSDMGGANVGVWKQLGVNINKPYFANEITQNKIYVFADAPHMIKLLRNHYLDNGLTLENAHVVSKECVEKLISLSSKNDLKLAHKITQAHIDVKGPQRQRVKPAVQIFSNTTAMALKLCFEKKLIKKDDHENTVNFFLTVNQWFDILNSKNKFGDHQGVNAYGINQATQKSTLEKMTKLMTTMRVGGHSKLLPFQKGIIISNKSLQLLYDDLKCRKSISYIRTIKLNSDVLENMFSYLRGMGSTNEHPSAFNFRYRLRWYLLGKHSQAVFMENKNTNDSLNESNLSAFNQSNEGTTSTDEEDKTITEEMFNHLRLDEQCEPDNSPSEEDTILLEVDASEKEDITENILSEEGLKYVTGYVCHRFRSKYPHLGNTANNNKDDDNPSEWINLLNRGSLIYPSKTFLDIAIHLEAIFQKEHGDYFKRGQNILTNMYNLLRQDVIYDESVFPKPVIICWVRTRIFIRIKELNRKLRGSNKRSETKKMKKIIS